MKCTQSFLAIPPVKSVCSFRYAELLQVVNRVYIISYLQASTTVPLPCLQCMHFTLVLAKGVGVGRGFMSCRSSLLLIVACAIEC